MLSFLRRRAVLIVLGFLLLALFIWFAGPYFAFADYVPLESRTARLIVILLTIGLWLLSFVVKRVRANRASDKLVAAVVKQSETEQRPSAEAVQLRERFEEAVATLKQKRGGHTLYDLPWYVFIGAPGSGKTTALVNSGLKFPLEQRTGRGALRGVGGTRNCDWWFTDEAVFLDTAGRYTTQDSDAAADSAAWTEFLALLRKYRKRRPVNGIILTISAQDLMTQVHGGSEAHVAAARKRLNELNTELRIQLPVYLMVTKCDLVAGFTEYFDDLAHDGRAQVWGVTFPYEQTRNGEAARAFPAEFDALITRLNARLFTRLEEERDIRRRAKMFAFPQQMAALRDALGQFVADVFATTSFDQQIPLRGVYFTSGTQEGTPIDRLLGAIGRRFAVAPEAVVAPPGRGKAYFIERLLTDVLLGESGLAGVNRRLEVEKAALQLGAYVAMVLIAVLGVIAFSVSYSRNRTYVGEVAAQLASLQQVPPVPASAALESTLPRLDAVRAVVDSANRYRDDTPWARRWGLYQGSSLGNTARDAYARELDGALLPRVASRFERRLVEFAPEPEKLYEYLKAYLMLGQPERLDVSHLRFIGDLEWEAAYGTDPDTRASVTKHFRSLLESEERLRPMALDESLVTQARSTIRQASVPGLMYRQIRVSYAGDTARALKLNEKAGVGAEQVLRRKSGVPLSEPVPSLYTKPVFEEITRRGTADLVKQFALDHWVWGEGGFSTVTGTAKLSEEMIDVYEKDYIAAWDGILNDLDVVQFTAAQTSAKLAILGGDASPLRGFLKIVDEHTFLAKPPEQTPQATGIKSRLDQIFTKGKEAVLGKSLTPGLRITTHFEPIHRLVVAGPSGGAPIDSVVGKIGQIQQKLAPVGDAFGQKPLDPSTSVAVGELARSLRIEAAAMPPPVAAVVTKVGSSAIALSAGDLRRSLDSRYREEVARPCLEAIDGRYPFSPNTRDVALADFGRIFGPNGVFDQFFRSSLSDQVDTTNRPWRWRTDVSGMAMGGSRAMLDQFQTASRIREVFFRSGSQIPEVRFIVTPLELDATATRFLLEIDGQSVNYRHEAAREWPTIWPGPKPGAAVATFEVRAGGRPNLPFDGPWAWFRLVDAGKLQRETDLRYTLALQAGGQQARVRIEATTVLNPFADRDWRQFRCGI